MAKEQPQPQGEQDETPETPEQHSQTEAEAAAAFSAGFKKVHGDTPPTSAPATAPEQAPEPAAEPAEKPAEAQPEPEPEPVVLAGMTEAQLKAALAKANQFDDLQKQVNKAFGKFGELQREMQASRQGAGLTPRQINAESFKRLKAEYPEIADLLGADLSEVMVPAAASPTVSEEQIKQLIDQRANEIMGGVNQRFEDREERLLKRFHPDYEDIAKSDDLQLWLGTQSADYRQQFLESRDSVFIADQLDRFKAWREQSQSQRQRSQRRLETNVQPRSGSQSGPPTLSAEDQFRRGFMRASGG